MTYENFTWPKKVQKNTKNHFSNGLSSCVGRRKVLCIFFPEEAKINKEVFRDKICNLHLDIFHLPISASEIYPSANWKFQ